MQNWWEKDAVAAPQGGMRPLTGADPAKVAAAEQAPYKTEQERYEAIAAPDRARLVNAQADKAEREAALAGTQEENERNDKRQARVQSLRNEFQGIPQVKKFNNIRAAGKQIQRLGESDTPQADIALIFSFMKALDDGSTVREGEFATAQNAAGVPDQIKNLYNQVAAGNRLSPQQRAEMVRTAGEVYMAQAELYNEVAKQYQPYFMEIGEDPNKHILLAAGPLNEGQAPQRMDDATYMATLDRLIKAGDRAAIDRFMQEQGAAEKNPGEIDRAIAAGAGAVQQPEEAGPGILDQLRGSAQNTIAGLAQGAAWMVDAPTQALGATLGVAADSLPGVPEWFSDSLKSPVTIGGTIEQAVPTPQDTTSQAVRFGSQLTGGIASLPSRATNALANTIVGKVPGNPSANALAPASQELGAAARDLQVDVPRFVAGGPTAQRLGAAAEQTPLGAPVIQRATGRMLDQSAGARDRIASNVGEVLADDGMGETAKAGAKAFVGRTSERGGDLYAKAEKLSEGATVKPTAALANLDEHIARISQAPGGSKGLKVLKDLRAELSSGRFSVSGIRDMRTTLRDDFIREGLRGSDLERRVNQVIDAASEDIVTSLKTQGKQGAAKAYQLADRYWRNRLATIDQVLEPIIGDGSRTTDEVVRAINSQVKNNGGRVAKFIRTLPPEEAANVRATLIGQLGKARNGSQDAAGEAFSLDTFLTNWNEIKSARAAIFDKPTVESLNKLAVIADRAKATGRARNSSNTGSVVATLATGGALGGAGYGIASGNDQAASIMLGVGTILAQRGGATLLASPKFTQHLARMPAKTSNPAATKAWIKGFNSVSRTSPALAAQVDEFQKFLMGAVNDNVSTVTRAAASDGTKPERN